MKIFLIFPVFTIAIVIGLLSCGSDGSSLVSITPGTGFYQVTILSSDGNHYAVGREYGQKVLATVPDYEQLIDSYLKELQEAAVPVTGSGIPGTAGSIPFAVMIERALEIKKQIDPLYLQELDGFASTLSGGDHDELGDGKLSRNEYLLLNLVPDIATTTACSALAVTGARSATGKTIVGRITDWFPGSTGQFGALNALVHTRTGSKQVASFGWLGVLGNLVAINSSGVYIANLYSPVGGAYSAVGRRSILLDIRKAMETSSTLDEVANYLKDPAKLYGYNHNMFLADATTTKVLENDFNRTRALRGPDSALNPGIVWGFSNAVASVNSFLLLGNDDNHTPAPVNTERWAKYKSLLAAQGSRVDFNGMKSIITYHKPGANGTDNGDIYGNTSIQAIVYSFDDKRLECWLRPHSGSFTDQPQFISIKMPF